MKKETHKQKAMNELEFAAADLGFNPKTFVVMKSRDRERFDYIAALYPSSFKKAWIKYVYEKQKVFVKSKDMYEDLLSKRKLTGFSNYLYEQNVFNRSDAFKKGVYQVINNKKNTIGYHSTFLQYKLILKLYKEFK